MPGSRKTALILEWLREQKTWYGDVSLYPKDRQGCLPPIAVGPANRQNGPGAVSVGRNGQCTGPSHPLGKLTQTKVLWYIEPARAHRVVVTDSRPTATPHHSPRVRVFGVCLPWLLDLQPPTAHANRPCPHHGQRLADGGRATRRSRPCPLPLPPLAARALRRLVSNSSPLRGATRQLPSLQLRWPCPSPPAAAATEVEPALAGPSCAAGAAHARVPS